MCDLNYYILSLSQNYDDLAMWRMYAKDGCNAVVCHGAVTEHGIVGLHLGNGLDGFLGHIMANDSVATNFDQIFETYSPETVRKVL